MPELLLVLVLFATGTAERLVSGARHAAERKHLLALITAAAVSPTAAAIAARPPVPAVVREPKPEQVF